LTLMWVYVKKSYSVGFNLMIVVRIVIVMFVEKTHESSLRRAWHAYYANRFEGVSNLF